MRQSKKTSNDNEIDKLALMMICYVIGIIALLIGIVWFVIIFWKVSLFIFVACLIFYKLRTKK
jgi:hypothetical protein